MHCDVRMRRRRKIALISSVVGFCKAFLSRFQLLSGRRFFSPMPYILKRRLTYQKLIVEELDYLLFLKHSGL